MRTAAFACIALVGVGLAGLDTGCRARKTQEVGPAVIASVNGETLSRQDFEHELARELASSEAEGPLTPDQVEPIKKSLLNTVIERALLLQAARVANVTVPAADVDREVLRISSDFPAEGFNEALSEGQLSMSDLKQKTLASLTIQKLFEEHVYPRVGVTEEELRAYFDSHAKDFQLGEEVRAAQIVVQTLDEAKHIQAQLKAGKKFPDLARRYSLSADAKLGGDLGYFPRGVMPPEFDEAAFKLPVGQTSEVVTTEYGFHLFKVLDKRPPRKKELAQVRGEVEKKLLALKREQAQRDYLQRLKDAAQLQVNEPVLQALYGGGTHALHPANAAAAK